MARTALMSKKAALFFFLSGVLIIGLYVIFRPKAAELNDVSYIFKSLGKFNTTEWNDTIQNRHMMRFEADRELDEQEMSRFADFARKNVSNDHFTILFHKENTGADYARIDYPGGILKQLTGFGQGTTTK